MRQKKGKVRVDNRSRQTPCRRGVLAGGFTLIELLVVIAILSLLVSILLPSLQSAKELARSMTCLSNLRTMAMTSFLYHQDNDQKLFSSYFFRDEDYKTGGLHAPGITSYLDLKTLKTSEDVVASRSHPTVMTCPSSWGQWPAYELWQRTIGVSIFSVFAPGSAPGDAIWDARDVNPSLSADAIQRPSEMSFFFDSGTSSPGPLPILVGFPDHYYYWACSDSWRIRNSWYNGPPHIGENDMNVVYWDGHAAGMPIDNVTRETDYYGNNHTFFTGQ